MDYSQLTRLLEIGLSAAFKGAPASFEEAGLSDIHLTILPLMAQGLTRDEIAEQLGRNCNTVATHISNIYDELGLSSRKCDSHTFSNRAAATAWYYLYSPSPPEPISALREWFPLLRENQKLILVQLVQGKEDREIAYVTGMNYNTTRDLVKRVLARAGANNRSQVTASVVHYFRATKPAEQDAKASFPVEGGLLTNNGTYRAGTPTTRPLSRITGHLSEARTADGPT